MDDGLPTGSRPPPPTVPPIVHKGVRYVQDLDGPPTARDQSTGYLLAMDPDSDKVLWELKVYRVQTQPGLEADVQEVYFTSMELLADRDALLIENENGERYVVDLNARSTKPAD